MPDAPPAVFVPATGGSPPAAPGAVFVPTGGGGAPAAPGAVFVPTGGGGAPAAPGAVFTPPGGGGSQGMLVTGLIKATLGTFVLLPQLLLPAGTVADGAVYTDTGFYNPEDILTGWSYALRPSGPGDWRFHFPDGSAWKGQLPPGEPASPEFVVGWISTNLFVAMDSDRGNLLVTPQASGPAAPRAVFVPPGAGGGLSAPPVITV